MQTNRLRRALARFRLAPESICEPRAVASLCNEEGHEGAAGGGITTGMPVSREQAESAHRLRCHHVTGPACTFLQLRHVARLCKIAFSIASKVSVMATDARRC